MIELDKGLASKGHTALVVLTACGLTVAIIALAMTFAVTSYRGTVGKARENARFISSLVAAQASMILVDIEGALARIAVHVEATSSGPLRGEVNRGLQDILQSIRHGESYMDSLQVSTARGEILSQVGPHVAGSTVPEALAKPHAAGSAAIVIGLPQEDPLRPDTWIFEIRRAVWNGAGVPTHIVTATIKLDELVDAFDDLEMPAGISILVTSLSGRIFIDEPGGRQFIGRTIPSLREYIAGSGHDGTFIGKSPLDNTEIVAGSMQLTRFPVMVFALLPLDLVLEPWRHHAMTFGSLSVVLVLIAAFLSYALVKSQMKINSQSRALAMAASTDQLTGAFNRRSFLNAAKREFSRVNRYGGELACIMLDLDHFKNINDAHGHPAGDLALSETARLVRARLRESDLFCRYGGEEFVLLLPGTDLAGAGVVAETLRAGIAKLSIRLESPTIINFTASFGVATVRPSGDASLDALLVRADKALYLAKSQGRNRVCLAEPETKKETAAAEGIARAAADTEAGS